MPASKAIINNPVLVYPDPAIGARYQISAAMFAKSLLNPGRKPYFVLHCNSSCYPDILV